MYKKVSLKAWRNFFKDRGIAQENLDQYMEYVRVLNKNNVPVIFEFEHLSKLLGIKQDILASMINSPASFYRTFRIPKYRGGFREIDAPYPSLLGVQRWIYQNILKQQSVHSSVHGFVPKKSIITNAKKHVGKVAFLKIDLKDFFPSITINWIINVFRELGYAQNVAYYLAALCCYNSHLSQGAATSPYLSNIVSRHLDNRLSKLSKSYSLIYTRYADDLAFSGKYIPAKFIEIATKIINECKFEVNKNKTILSVGPGKRILTGISIAEDKICLPRYIKRAIKKEAYYIVKFGYFSHASKNKIRNPFYLESLYGKLQFWRNVEPDNETASFYIKKIKAILDVLNGS